MVLKFAVSKQEKVKVYPWVSTQVNSASEQINVALVPICIGTIHFKTMPTSKLYIPSTLNIGLILWHTQLIVCAVKC